ncbi:hypothetical protein NHX12_025048 [Muraenolepis orangiensis]|uniref:Uncharacterized protein n=1 Tax=Muraenolepis orangiensis TaxID=630683 RepID=A0A9Q0EP75_9TELE|nr:hypothetical protein NHX12_025048 [Muraenolepis orangiensis]
MTTSSLSSTEVKVTGRLSGGTSSTSTNTMSSTAAAIQVTSSTAAATAAIKSIAVTTSPMVEPTTVSMPTKASPHTQETAATTAAVPVSTETPAKTAPPPSTGPTPTVGPSVQKVASCNTPSEASSPAKAEALPQGPTVAPSADSKQQCLASTPKEPVPHRDSEKDAKMEENTVEAKMDSGTTIQDKKVEISNSQAKNKTTESSEEKAKCSAPPAASSLPDSKPNADFHRRGSKQESDGEERVSCQKRSLSRQSSRESAGSSSPSSGCSTATLTRKAHHKKTYENRHPAKKRRVDASPDPGRGAQKGEEAGTGRGDDDKHPAASQRRHSRSQSSSTDSDQSEDRKVRRLACSTKRSRQDHDKVVEGTRPRKRATRSSERRNAAASTGGESGSDTSSVRTVGKYAARGKPRANSSPAVPVEPEVLGKRCSALNAAAKLLAMKGRVDTPGHTLRKDPKAAEKNQKPKCKSVPALPQTNSVNLSNNKAGSSSSGSKPSTPDQSSHSASRSTRRCPGSLVPPLEYKRSRSKKEGKEGDSSRGHSACSSASSYGEVDDDCSRSRSSSDGSSRRTPSLSSQSTGPQGSRGSRAASSGSERGRSSERRSARRDREGRSGEGRRESRRSTRRSHKLSQEVSSSSGAEGTPDRVLRSVAALAAVHARSPAASTRSSAGHQRHNKT